MGKEIYQFNFRPYKRRFVCPVQTNHGIWEIREGIIISLKSERGNIGWGEIAPIPWFGSETLEQALEFCSSLPIEISEEVISSIPETLPTCQFGFESALQNSCTDNQIYCNSLEFSALLPAGKSAIEAWQSLYDSGYRTFKWKIAVEPIAEEVKIFEQLLQVLPSGAIRLDANAGLSYNEAKQWLEICDQLIKSGVNIEFIEQPLPTAQFEEMLELTSHITKLALDESVATFQQLQSCYSKGWQQIFVIKPGIVGSPNKLRRFCQQYKIDAVFSSVFETDIGRNAALQLANELSLHQRAVGFGINHWFQENSAPPN
ncbi:MAG: o-succinylbenzoate synthase [Calothrix sp. C42_A2020_038]|nr:o-succinylbenzoate synthase [Calothrix sp. C42_A2020_038]